VCVVVEWVGIEMLIYEKSISIFYFYTDFYVDTKKIKTGENIAEEFNNKNYLILIIYKD